jgi:single-strand selective monofunctional uracil DNA glycosylase
MTHRLAEITDDLSDALDGLSFPEPVTHVYRPLRYARHLHRAYLDEFGRDHPRETLLVGMNPGPWGMGQTGVPFGDVDYVRDWMGLEGEVEKPENELPDRPVDGLDCERNEVSGSRLWGWAAERFGSAEAFFDRCYVHNYCPLLFLEESGRNRPPSRMKVAQRDKFTPACDEALRAVVDHLEPRFVIGVGNYARDRIRDALEDWNSDVDFTIGRMLHPSPASPKANQGWAEQAERQLRELDFELPGAE